MDSMRDANGETGVQTRRRKTALTTLDLHLLEQACEPVWLAFGSGSAGCTYLVGTAQTGGEYRDVDVRTILPDDEFDALFGAQDRNGRALWSLMCVAIGHLLAAQTGLPIDFQIQRMTEANEKHQGQRNPLGAGRREYAAGGDATAFPPLHNHVTGWTADEHDDEFPECPVRYATALTGSQDGAR